MVRGHSVHEHRTWPGFLSTNGGKAFPQFWLGSIGHPRAPPVRLQFMRYNEPHQTGDRGEGS